MSLIDEVIIKERDFLLKAFSTDMLVEEDIELAFNRIIGHVEDRPQTRFCDCGEYITDFIGRCNVCGRDLTKWRRV
jgi:hypothetical protein